MDSANWLLEHGNQITLVGYMAFQIAVASIALQKKWVVIGWVHSECEERLSKLEDAASKAADKANARLEILERMLDEERMARRRERGE